MTIKGTPQNYHAFATQIYTSNKTASIERQNGCGLEVGIKSAQSFISIHCILNMSCIAGFIMQPSIESILHTPSLCAGLSSMDFSCRHIASSSNSFAWMKFFSLLLVCFEYIRPCVYHWVHITMGIAVTNDPLTHRARLLNKSISIHIYTLYL